MRTSRRKYNKQYRDQHLYVDGYWNPEIIPTCNEHKRCEVCRSHVVLSGCRGLNNEWLHLYECPTCGKCYAVLHEDNDDDEYSEDEAEV